MTHKKINLALQVLPQAEGKNSYDLVDDAIAEIEASGLKYKVCPFETVIEGYYDEVMDLVKRVHIALEKSGTKKLMTYIKIQTVFQEDVTIEDKIHKYE
ncbi:thiamine-binding protein [Mangrovibacterium lignilyticum]|uniref:thiamine-binding protein n=1 Tax=Mangrovibacterium lignilyticum TaxID=2668052 RepID=UPI0013D6BC2B|nr:thiamine-binding protein [Mangrovibacterium lignilyticum]